MHNIKKVKKFLENQGFKEVGSKSTGSHHKYRNPDGRITTLIYHNEGESLTFPALRSMADNLRWDVQALNDALLEI